MSQTERESSASPMTWSPQVYHRIIMVDLQQLSQEVGSYSHEHSKQDQRYRLSEITRFARKVEENARLAMVALEKQA